jgi:hypothetical protein
MLSLNNLLGFNIPDLRQYLRDRFPFFAPRTSSITQSRGSGTPTETRATVGTIENNDGYLVTAIAGEIRPKGARRIRNLLAAVAGMSSEDLTTAGWNVSGATANTGSLVEDGSTGLHYLYTNAVGVVGHKTIFQCRASIGSGNRLLWVGDGAVVAEFNLSAGTAYEATGGITADMSLVSPGVYDLSVTIHALAAANINIGLASGTGSYSYTGDGASSINISRVYRRRNRPNHPNRRRVRQRRRSLSPLSRRRC